MFVSCCDACNDANLLALCLLSYLPLFHFSYLAMPFELFKLFCYLLFSFPFSELRFIPAKLDSFLDYEVTGGLWTVFSCY